jgi:hypothetical protein
VPFHKDNILVIFILNGRSVQIFKAISFARVLYISLTLNASLDRTEAALNDAKSLAEKRLRILQETEEELRKLKENILFLTFCWAILTFFLNL